MSFIGEDELYISFFLPALPVEATGLTAMALHKKLA